MRLGRRFWAALAVGVAVGGAAAAGLGPWIRSAVVERAGRLGLRAVIQSAFPALDGLRLRGVSLELEGVPGVRVWVDEVRVDWGTRRPVAVHGVTITALGDASALRERLERWRSARSAVGEPVDGHSGPWPRVDGVVLDWRRGTSEEDERVHVSNATLLRGESKLEVTAELASARIRGVGFRLTGVSATVAKEGPSWRLAALKTDGIEVSQESDVALLGPPTGSSAVVPSASAASPEPKEVPSARSPSESLAREPSRMGVEGAIGARIRVARARLQALANVMDELLLPKATVTLEGTRIRLQVDAQRLELGPGTLSMRRAEGMLTLELEPTSVPPPVGRDALERPLRFRLSVPVPSGKSGTQRALRAELSGGPLPLAQLGLKEGDLGLSDVAKATLSSDLTLEFDETSEVARVDGSGKVRRLSIRHPKLADDTLAGLELAWRGTFEARLDGSSIDARAIEVDVGQFKILLAGTYKHEGPVTATAPPFQHAKVDVRFDLPLTNCQAIFDSLPTALVPKLAGMSFAGSLAARGHVRFDTDALPQSYDVDWDGTQSCRILEAPETVRLERFRRPFEKLVYTPEGEERTMTFGPGSPQWVPFQGISKFMQVAVQLCEDGRFFRHHGFDKEAIVNSMRDNLIAGGFRRGASTISMQLAKNLFLSRDKVLSRKLQEAILTLYLEQELTKQEILELYFNVIEYGPMVYGIGPAARHHFGTTPFRLTLGQSLYLASILQNPKKQFYGSDGAVMPARMDYLRKLMKLGAKIHLLSDSEVEEGMEEPIVFGQPGSDADDEADDEKPSDAGTSNEP